VAIALFHRDGNDHARFIAIVNTLIFMHLTPRNSLAGRTTLCTRQELDWTPRSLHTLKPDDIRRSFLASPISHSRPAGYALLFSAVSDGGFVFLKRFLPALVARWLIGLVLD